MTIHSPRSLYHFTPPTNWMNDPNGLVHYEGEYHLFYQHHPYSMDWGPMHWGHAVSRDLLQWEHLPIALYPDEHGAIFSGTAVIDWHNTAGFGAEAMVAIFTYHLRKGYESQGIAVSLDKGRTWHKYEGNPVILPPEGEPDFRDPKVFWYEKGAHWVMVLSVGPKVGFYTSPNLKDWTSTSQFSTGYGTHGAPWEVPDLFQLPIDGGKSHSRKKWVLTVSVMAGGLHNGRGVQYFIGEFDGQTFISDDPPERIRWLDYGADFYANISWSDMPDSRRILLGWMSNWTYAHDIPLKGWRGAMSLPHDVSLVSVGDDVHLAQQPIQEISRLWGSSYDSANELPLTLECDGLDIHVQFDAPTRNMKHFGLILRWANGCSCRIGIDCQQKEVYIDRTEANDVTIHDIFNAIHTAPLRWDDDSFTLRLIYDRISLELFADAGQIVFTDLIYPQAPLIELATFAEGEEIGIKELIVREL